MQLRFDGDFNISFWTEARRADAYGAPVEPNTLEELSVFVPLLNDVVTDVRVNEGGDLSLTVGNVEVHCPAHPDYEAWSFNGPNGVLLVCKPRGQLAVWDAH